MTWRRVSQALKVPTRATCRALGAHTRKATPFARGMGPRVLVLPLLWIIGVPSPHKTTRVRASDSLSPPWRHAGTDDAWGHRSPQGRNPPGLASPNPRRGIEPGP